MHSSSNKGRCSDYGKAVVLGESICNINRISQMRTLTKSITKTPNSEEYHFRDVLCDSLCKRLYLFRGFRSQRERSSFQTNTAWNVGLNKYRLASLLKWRKSTRYFIKAS